MSKKPTESVFETAADDSLWLEWSDAVLNKENWTAPKSNEDGPDGLFRDTRLVQLPSSLEPHEWIRAKDLPNLTEPLTLFVPTSEYPDFIANNEHLLHSEFSRWFISAVINLQYCGQDGLEVSGENGNFVWNGRDQSWQGWLNVYSMNKAGKGVQHRPITNPNGKYIVRLYFLGRWRRIVVDDMIPLNAKKLPLLPRTSYDFELWPMLLSKALLKIASLTWSEGHEIIDFHPVACLTGWVCLELNVGYMSPGDKWDFLRKYADHFEWQDETERENQGASRSGKSKEAKPSKETVRTKKSKDTDRTDVSKKTKNAASGLKALAKPQPVTLFLGLEDMKEVAADEVPDLAPCSSHFIHVAQSRDVPLDPKNMKPPLARWKLYRWLKWAISEGKIDPVEYFLPIRSLKVVSPLKQYKESVINRYGAASSTESVQNGDNVGKTKIDQSDAKSRAREKLQIAQKSATVEKIQDISFWADFNKIEPFIKNVQFFYKLDYFQYTARLSDRFGAKQQNGQISDTKKGSKKGSRKSSPVRATFEDPEFIDTHDWPQKMSKTRNEPLYIFTDSLEEKFFLINFSTFQLSVDIAKVNGNENGTSNSTTILRGKKDCLSIEKHNWFRRAEKSNCLISIVTAGTKSNVLEIDRGRHLLRLYCHSESDSATSISSDTIFHVGDRRRMYQLMSTESESVDRVARLISNSVSNAYQSFGTEKYSEALNNYYRSYLPRDGTSTKEDKQLHNQIHDYFIEEEVQLIRKIMPERDVPAVLRSLRIFFLDPSIGLECFNAVSIVLQDSRESNVTRGTQEYDSKYDTSGRSSVSKLPNERHAATIIQSFFRMIIIRKYKQIHNPKHEQHQTVLDNLLKVVELFNYNKQELLGNQLFRNVLTHHDKLYDIYPCSKDFEYTLQMHELSGTIQNAEQNQWLPIARLVVNPQMTETVLASIDLFVNLPRYSVRVFNNETGQEILRVVNNVVPTRYAQTKLGYTIFCYGWSEDRTFRDLPYLLNIVSVKGRPMFQFLKDETTHPTIAMPPVLMIEELSNNYIPNSENFISKWIVRIVKSCVVSFRLRASYDNVRMRFSVADKKNRVLAQVKGTSVVILPVAYLDFTRESEKSGLRERNSVDGENNNDNNTEETFGEERIDVDEDTSNEDLSEHTTYYAEASILDDSWPLTRAEWSIVSEFKVKPTGSLIKTKLPHSWSAGKLSKTESLKSRSESMRSKRGSKPSVSSGPTLESPYWILQVVTDSESGLEIFQDRRRENEIARMKEMWAAENPDSLQRGRELREAFIKKHEIQPKSSTCSLERDPSGLSERLSLTKSSQKSSTMDIFQSQTSTISLEGRTLKAPPSLRRLPPLDLSIYEEKEDICARPFVRTESNEKTERDMRVLRIFEAEQGYADFLKEMENLIEKQKERYRTLYGDYEDAFWERRVDLENAYEARQAYINSMKLIPASTVKSARNKKSKASKKT